MPERDEREEAEKAARTLAEVGKNVPDSMVGQDDGDVRSESERPVTGGANEPAAGKPRLDPHAAKR